MEVATATVDSGLLKLILGWNYWSSAHRYSTELIHNWHESIKADTKECIHSGSQTVAEEVFIVLKVTITAGLVKGFVAQTIGLAFRIDAEEAISAARCLFRTAGTVG